MRNIYIYTTQYKKDTRGNDVWHYAPVNQ